MFIVGMCLDESVEVVLDRALSLHDDEYQMQSHNHPLQRCIQPIYLIHTIPMNPDCYSDVKLAERFFFENSIYLLNMFEKKLDSFINSKPRKVRERERAELFHVSNIIDPDAKNEDPIRILSKDLTKPIWHCVTKTDPVAICIKNGKPGDCPEMVAAMNDLFACFLLRLKHEHEDESNLRIGLEMTDRSCKMEDFANRDSDTRVWPRLQELLRVLEKVREKYEKDLKGLKEKGEQNQFMEVYLQWSKLMFQEATLDEKGEDLTAEQMRIPAELYHFVSVVCKNMEEVIESAQGPTLINYWPDLHYLPDLIHPMLMAIYVIVRGQLSGDRSRQSTNASVSNSQQHIEEESNCVFDELPERNFSKITFINLDGYDSPFNLTLAKSLSRYLQYIAFPCDQAEALTHQPYAHYFDNYSEFLVKHYVHSELTEEERQLQHRLFKTKNKTDKELTDYYRQLLVFPVHSRFLSQRYDLSSAEFYQSKFIKFIMKEVVLIQVREFNPSLVVISLSHRLHLEPDFFEQLMKELTIIGNMRLVLYHNLTRSYMFEGSLPERLLPCQEAYDCHRLYARTFDRPSALITNNQINLTILQRTAAFLKIASGTYSLERAVEEDNVTEKYDIFRVQRYAGTLVKLIGKSHPVLQRFKNRFNQYLRLERLLTTMYDSDRNTSNEEDTTYPLFHRALLDLTKTLIEDSLKGQTQAWQGFMKGLSQEYVEAEWDKFALRYRLEVRKEREEEDYKFITRLRREKPKQQGQNKGGFIALEFQIVRDGVGFLVNLGKQSQICIDPVSQSKAPLVYLFNHLFDNRETVLRSYCGEVTQSIEDTYQGKVRLMELEIPWHPQHPFQSLTRFNYLETASAVLLFWPTLYDQARALAFRFMHAEYHPTITNLIFAADRSTPHRLIQVEPVNASYLHVLPRSGCTCYQVPSTNLVYIFGGFYGCREDYLNFQTDITVARLGQQLEVDNLPKTFYFDYEDTKPNLTDLPYRITRLSSDFVRPRIEYEVYPLEGGEDLQSIRILLVGGVGERFLRPYSMIGYMAHQLTFTKEGILQSVRRIRLHNVVPANLRRPLRTRTAVEVQAVHSAQNRQFYLKKTGMGVGSAMFSWFQLKYERENEKMTYKHGGDLALLPENKEERTQNTIIIRQNNSLVTAKALLRHYSSLKEVDNKLALVYQYGGPVEQSGSLIFSLELQLAEEVYVRFVNLSSRQVPLTGSHLIAVDTLGLEVFAVLRHEEYTGGRCVLAYCDIAGGVQALVEGTERKILLREVYHFDGDIRGCTVKALSDRRIAIVHGFPMHPGAKLPECILKRTSRGNFVREEVLNDHPTYALNTFLSEELYHSTPLSFFLASKQGLVCWSFRSCSRGMGEEEYYFLVEELSCHQETKRWRLKTQKTVRFQKTSVSSREFPLCVTTILDIRVTAERKYELFLLEGGRVFLGSFDSHLESSSNTMSFKQYERPLEEYEMEKYRQRFNVEYLQKLTKYPQMYVDAIEEMEAEKMMV